MTSSNGKIFRVTGRLCESPVTGEFPAQRPVTWMFSLICAGMNGWVNNREAGDLRRHHAHYDVTVMKWHFTRTDTRALLCLRVYFDGISYVTPGQPYTHVPLVLLGVEPESRNHAKFVVTSGTKVGTMMTLGFPWVFYFHHSIYVWV